MTHPITEEARKRCGCGGCDREMGPRPTSSVCVAAAWVTVLAAEGTPDGFYRKRWERLREWAKEADDDGTRLNSMDRIEAES